MRCLTYHVPKTVLVNRHLIYLTLHFGRMLGILRCAGAIITEIELERHVAFRSYEDVGLT